MAERLGEGRGHARRRCCAVASAAVSLMVAGTFEGGENERTPGLPLGNPIALCHG